MFYRRNFMTRTLRVAMGCTLIAALLQSCDETYDLEKIGGDVQVFENGLSAPVGDTQKFYLGDFITEDAMLTVENGEYVLQYNGSTGSTSFEVPEMHFDEIEPSLETTHIDFYESLHEIPEFGALMDQLGYTGGPLPNIPGLEAPDAHAEIPATTEPFSISIGNVPDQVINVQNLMFKEGAVVTLSLHAEGFPESITHLTFDFKMRPPKQMRLVPIEDDIIEETGRIYHITHDLPVIDGKLDDEVHFQILGFLFDPALEAHDHTIDVNTDIHYEGYIHINEPFDLSGWTPVLDLKVGFVMSESDIESIAARAKVDVDPIEVSTALTGLPDILTQSAAILDLQSVHFEMDVNNSSPITLETGIEMQTTFVNGTQSPLIALEQPLHVEANSHETLILTNEQEYAGQPGYVPNLNELVSQVPQSIYFKATPYMPESDVELVLGSVFNFNADYRMSVPLEFGDELSLSLDTDVTGLNTEGEYLAYARRAVVSAQVVNTLPLDLTLTALAIDRDGNVMNNVRVEDLPLVINGSSNTNIEIELMADGDKATLAKVAGVRLNFQVTSKTGGELRPDQYVQLNNIAVSLPKGVVVPEDEIFN